MNARVRVEELAAADLPPPSRAPRITTSEVCQIARLSRITIQRRVAAGKLPQPIDRGREQIFDRGAIYQALGIRIEGDKDAVEAENPWERSARAMLERQAPGLHGRRSA